MTPALRRLAAIVVFAGIVATGKACEPDVCTTYDVEGRETVTTTRQSRRCAELHDILTDLRSRDPGGPITLDWRPNR